jgi:hypothetical protein
MKHARCGGGGFRSRWPGHGRTRVRQRPAEVFPARSGRFFKPVARDRRRRDVRPDGRSRAEQWLGLKKESPTGQVQPAIQHGGEQASSTSGYARHLNPAV